MSKYWTIKPTVEFPSDTRRILTLAVLFQVICFAGRFQPQACYGEESQYVRSVRPILEKHCYQCHGQSKQNSGLRLDVREAAFRGGENFGPSIVPKEPENSPIIELVTAPSHDARMPPKGDGLSPEEIQTLVQWIHDGANWPDGVDLVQIVDKREHWSFQPLLQGHSNTSIDELVAEKLGQHGLIRSPEAAAMDWLRRVTIDLSGLLPTPQEVDEFNKLLSESLGTTGEEGSSDLHTRQSAYLTVVDRLLGSERYGERWGQHWLDVVRYADTHGFEVNTERPNAWPYRDYIIRAFNRDTPYDQFVREQIAGDAYGQDAATGFLVTASVLLPGQIGKDAPSIRLARQDSLDEMVNNISQSFLGLSVGCARCHDHKFDPISSRDYYSMQAFVAGVEYDDRELNDLESKARRQEAQQIRNQLNQIELQLATLSPLAMPVSSEITDARQQRSADRQQLTTVDSQDRSTVLTEQPEFTLRPAIGASPTNVDRFLPRLAKKLRFIIQSTNSLEPCLDELEVFDSMNQNVALASWGTKLKTSGDTLVANRHEPTFINDGRYGNESSWLGDETGKGWIELEFPTDQEITRVAWSRDRQGVFEDRLPLEYRIELLCDKQWELVADSSDRRPHIAGMSRGPAFVTDGLSAHESAIAVKLLAFREQLEKQWTKASAGQFAFAGKFRQPDTIHMLLRGDPEQPREEVGPSMPSLMRDAGISTSTMLGLQTEEQQRRIALAEWITHPRNPLTARVMVNRIWQWHFGQGLVTTASDFGLSGSRPSHAELLDWLAQEFIESGWSIKHMHRRIVLSQTYRQACQVDASQPKIDSENRWLGRYPVRRREAESIRDSMLFVSGRLDTSMYGPGFDLFEQRGGLSGFQPIESLNDENCRRMIYSHKVRRESEAVFGAFDCPDAGQSTAVRRDSTTPIQALNLMNSRFTLECSELFAERVRSEAGSEISKQIELAYMLALSRHPTPEEVTEVTQVVAAHGIQVLCRALFNCNEFLFIP